MNQAFLGSDVSKGYADFCLVDQQGLNLCQPFKEYDTTDGHFNLINRLTQLKQDHQVEQILCGFESTGGYENNWIRSLSNSKMNLKVYRINPLRIHHEIKSNMDRSVTDKEAARTICNYVKNKSYLLHEVGLNSEKYMNCRKVYAHIQTLFKMKNVIGNQLEKLLYSNIPELLQYCRSGYPSWMLQLLMKCPSREKLMKVNIKRLSKIKGLSTKKAQGLKNKIKQGIEVQEDKMACLMIKSLTKQILDIDNEIKKFKKVLAQEFDHPYRSLLMSIGGIAEFTASAIILEIEEIEKFESAKKLVSYFGINPSLKISGDKNIKSSMSKKGRASYRAIIYMAARNVCLYEPYFKEIYIKLKVEGRAYNEIMGIIMNKLTRVIYGMLKSEKRFDAAIDKKHKERTLQNATSEKLEKQIKRIQRDYNKAINAPVSRKNLNKKRKGLEHQDIKSISGII